MTDAFTEGQPTGVIEEEASPHVSYTTQVGLGSKMHDPSPVHASLSNGIQFMGIYAEYDQHISPWQRNVWKILLLFPRQPSVTDGWILLGTSKGIPILKSFSKGQAPYKFSQGSQ